MLRDYYYNLLNNYQQRIYDSVLDAAKRFDKNAKVGGGVFLSNADFEKTIDALRCDHPELYYMNFNMSVTGGFFSTTLHLNYTISKNDRKKYDNALENFINFVKTKCQNLKGEYEKALFVHDIFAENVVYDLKEKNAYDMLGPILHKRGVCQGIAFAYKYILDELGVDCITAVGDVHSSTTNGPHAWNLVKVAGRWYHVDVTLDLKQGDTFFHAYFMNNDSDTFINHKYKYRMSIECRFINDNYFYRNKSFFTDIDKAAQYIVDKWRDSNVVEVKILRADKANNIKNLMNAIARNGGMYNFFIYPIDQLDVYAVYKK